MEIDRSRMPVLAFAACCLLALAVAFVTREWTAALALALAGVALALAMRANFERHGPEGTLPPLRDSGETSLDELRAEIAERDMELDTMRASIDGLAEVIEALVAEGSSGAAFAPHDGLRALTGQIEALEARLAAIESAPAELAGRIDALEASLARLAANAEAKARAVALRSLREEDGPVAVHPAETGGPSRRSRLGALRDLALGGAAPAAATAAGTTREKAPSVEVIPLFGPRLEDAEASLVAVGRALRPVEDGLAVLRLARDLAEDAAEGAGALIFARLDPAALDSEDFTEAALWLFEQAGEAEFRIVPMIPQAALEDGQPELLEKLAERGIGFALEDIRDWSLDLPALAKLGLRHILVDGPAMLRAAKSQKGEPSRLKAVLARSDIGLIAGNLADMDEVADVAALHADLLTGPALAGPRILEPA